MISGCASVPDCEPVYETVVEYRDRLVPVDDSLTTPQDPPTLEPVTWLDGVVLGVQYRHKWEACEVRLNAIRETHGGQR